MKRNSRLKKARRQTRNRPRQIFIVLAIGIGLGAAAFGTDAYMTAKRQVAATQMTAAMAKAPKTVVAANDDEMYTGSILFTPDVGNVCHQLLFDNQNGGFIDNGYVDCAHAAYRGVSETSAKYWPVARVRVISDGFRTH
jgi:hypothetical protein